MVDELKPPSGLRADGRRLWRSVVRELAGEGLVLDSREAQWLLSACELTDQLAVIKAAMAGEPLMVRGSQGQQVANPLLNEIRQHHLLISQTLARLKKPDEPAGVLGVVGATNRARGAANRRWRGPGA
jgi:P27 family predicted phage terminase small subunit